MLAARAKAVSATAAPIRKSVVDGVTLTLLSVAKTSSAVEVVDLAVRSGHHRSSMITLVLHLLRLLPVLVGGHRELALENLALRQQLAVYKRVMIRPRLRRT